MGSEPSARPELSARSARHAALGDPVRLAIVDELTVSDRAPIELRHRFGLASNLLAHHLDVLEAAGLVERSRSSGDRRRCYVRLRRAALADPAAGHRVIPGPALFICRQNSARSQLAAALWRAMTRRPARSAGTHPAARVHPGAVSAARRAGLDLRTARPRLLTTPDIDRRTRLVVTVCDQAHEELAAEDRWIHWSVPDPVPIGRAAAFDAVVIELRDRIGALLDPAAGAA